MKLKFLFSLSLATLALNAFANGDALARKAAVIAHKIRINEDRLNANDISQIDTNLNNIVAVLRQRPGDLDGLVCVSKDNDGLKPYQIAVTTGPVSNEKIPGTVVNTLEDCKQVINEARPLNFALQAFCVSKDNDGLKPYGIMLFDLEKKKVIKSAKDIEIGSLENCRTELKLAKHISRPVEGLKLCTSKDRDGLAPFVMSFLAFDGTLTLGKEPYNSLAACRAAL